MHNRCRLTSSAKADTALLLTSMLFLKSMSLIWTAVPERLTQISATCGVCLDRLWRILIFLRESHELDERGQAS